MKRVFGLIKANRIIFAIALTALLLFQFGNLDILLCRGMINKCRLDYFEGILIWTLIMFVLFGKKQ